MKHLKYLCLLFLLLFSPLSSENQTPSPPQIQQNKPPYFSEEEKSDIEKEPQFAELFIRMLVLLAVTLILFVLITFIAKRFLQSRMKSLNNAGRIQIIDQRALSHKSMLYIVKVDEAEMVLADSANGVTIVKNLKESQ